MELIKKITEIVNKILNTRKRKKGLEKEQVKRKDCLYIDQPIRDKGQDQIGVSVYVEKIVQAIEAGAEVIAITSDFGTGKSSLISLLQQEKQFNKIFKKYKFITISLWGFLKENNVIEIHKNFIYQFVSYLNRKSGSHLSKKMSKNFGVLRVGFGNRKATFGVFWAAVFFLVAEVIRRYSKEALQWGQKIWENANEVGLQNLSAFLYLGAIGIFFVIIIRTDIVFSSPKSEGNREIDENIIIDYYRMQVLDRGRKKHYIVVIEDLDRVRNPQLVFDFLIELRKYYIPEKPKSEKKSRKNKITFILCIKPAAQLQRELDKWNSKKATNNLNVQEKYSKIFDLIIQLKKINIDNYDAILEGLLAEKKEYLLDKELVKEENGSINYLSIEGIQWIIRGENLSIREMKQRLNDAFVLYDVLIEKFKEKRISLEKCIIASYLNNAYPEDMLLINDNTFERCIEKYIQGDKNCDESLKVCTEKFIELIQNLIETRQIEEDYRVYFYNYPKGSNLYNVFESKVIRTILYDLEPEEEFENALNNVSDEIIMTAMDKIVALGVRLPKVMLRYNKNMRIIFDAYPEKLLDYVESGLSYSQQEIARTVSEIDNILQGLFGYKPIKKEILQGFMKVWDSSIAKEELLEIRYMLCEKYRKNIRCFKKLFWGDNPLITIEEIKILEENMKIVWELFNYDSPMFEQSFFSEIHKIINKKSILEEEVQNFYIKAYEVLDKKIVVDYIVDTLEKESVIPEKIEDIIYEAVKEDVYLPECYIELLQKKDYSGKSVQNIHKMEWSGGLSRELCDALYKQGYYLDYLVNMAMNHNLEINFNDENVEQTIYQEVEEIYARNKIAFDLIRIRVLQLKLEGKYKLLYELPYLGINYRELEVINDTSRAISLMSVNLPIISIEDIVSYFNGKYQNPRQTAQIIDFLYDICTPQSFSRFFYELDMDNISFAKMSKMNRARIIDNIKKVGMVKTVTQKLKFMMFTKCLVEDFEKELFGKAEYETEYVRIINIVDKPTQQTIKNIEKFSQVHVFGAKVNEKLLKARLYKDYIYSVSVKNRHFIMPKDKELLEAAEEIFRANRWEELMKLLRENTEFMNYLTEKEVNS